MKLSEQLKAIEPYGGFVDVDDNEFIPKEDFETMRDIAVLLAETLDYADHGVKGLVHYMKSEGYDVDAPLVNIIDEAIQKAQAMLTATKDEGGEGCQII